MEALRAPVRDGGIVVSDCTLVRELGSRPVPTYAAIRQGTSGEREIVAVERLARTSTPDNLEDIALLMHDARRIALLNHPNLVRVRDVVVSTSDLLIINELVDAESYGSLMRLAPQRGVVVPLAVRLRVLVDALLGLSGLHGVRDAKGLAMNTFHGEIDPENVLVGVDGIARLAHTCRMRRNIKERPEGVPLGCMSPEILLRDKNADHRSDIYSAGVILWEALSGKSLFSDLKASAILKRQLGSMEPSSPPSEPWAAPLGAVAARALSADPGGRYATTAEMAAEIRRIAGAKLGSKVAVSTMVNELAGEKIRARRAMLTAWGVGKGADEDAETVEIAAPRMPTPAAQQRSSGTVRAAPPLPKPTALPARASASMVAAASPPVAARASASMVAAASAPVAARASASMVAAASPPVAAPASASMVAPASPPVAAPASASMVAPASPPVAAPASASMAAVSPPIAAPVSAPMVAAAPPPVAPPAPVPVAVAPPAPVFFAAAMGKSAVQDFDITVDEPSIIVTVPVVEEAPMPAVVATLVDFANEHHETDEPPVSTERGAQRKRRFPPIFFALPPILVVTIAVTFVALRGKDVEPAAAPAIAGTVAMPLPSASDPQRERAAESPPAAPEPAPVSSMNTEPAPVASAAPPEPAPSGNVDAVRAPVSAPAPVNVPAVTPHGPAPAAPKPTKPRATYEPLGI